MKPHPEQASGPELSPLQADVLRWCRGLQDDGLYPSVNAIRIRAATEGAHPTRAAVEKARKSLFNRNLIRFGKPDREAQREYRRKAEVARAATLEAVRANRPPLTAEAPGPAPAKAPRRRLGPLAGLIREHREVLRRQRGGRP